MSAIKENSGANIATTKVFVVTVVATGKKDEEALIFNESLVEFNTSVVL